MFQYLKNWGAKRELKQNTTAKYASGKYAHLPDRKREGSLLVKVTENNIQSNYF